MNTTGKCHCAILLSGLMLSELATAQTSIADADRSAWIDTTPRNFTSMIVAVEVATDKSSLYDVDIGATDMRILDGFAERFADVGSNLAIEMQAMCANPEPQTALEIGNSFDELERFEEREFERMFDEIIDLLSVDVGDALIRMKDSLIANNETASSIDWETYAELEPEAVLSHFSMLCRNMAARE